jgi:hypothetical protein
MAVMLGSCVCAARAAAGWNEAAAHELRPMRFAKSYCASVSAQMLARRAALRLI